ncbi:fibronectin type III domain-containing protein [Dactylosporangium sp. NPDC005572]|uniref:fibronectin type III domain-containing protein n=1 Tax=Dactylosporangium sp. NPDC005572 TaxID=3156889 RepID=UPI0033B3D6DF
MEWLRHGTVPVAPGVARQAPAGRHRSRGRRAGWRRPASLALAAVVAGAAGFVTLELLPAAAESPAPVLDAGRADCTTGTDGHCTITHRLGAVPAAVAVTLYAPLDGSGPLPYQLAADEYSSDGFRLRALTTDGSVYTGQLTVSYVAFGAPAASGHSPSMLPSGHPRRPAAPAGLTATPGDGQVKLCWEKAVNADGYDLYYRDVTQGQEWTLMPYPIADVCWTGGLFVNGHTYELKLRGANADGQGPDSAVVTVVPVAG